MADADLVLESFHTRGGVKTGALVRKITPTSLATLTCFAEPEGLFHAESRIEFDSEDPFSWRHFVQHTGDEFLERDHEAGDPGNVVPSYAEYLLVHELLRTGDKQLEFTRLDEGSGALQPARLVHDGDEVYLEVDGKVTNRHRVVGDEVLASDWDGIGSRPVHDLGELLDGLDGRVAVAVRNFVES